MKSLLSPGLIVLAAVVLMCGLHWYGPPIPLMERMALVLFFLLFIVCLVHPTALDFRPKKASLVLATGHNDFSNLLFLLFSALALFIFSRHAYPPVQFLRRSTVILVAIVNLCSLFTLAVAARREASWDKGPAIPSLPFRIAIALGILLPFSLGAAIVLNGAFDEGAMRFSFTSIQSKYSVGGRSASYYLRVRPFQEFAEPADIWLPQPVWSALPDRGNVEVGLRPGLLNIPWVATIKTSDVR